MFTFFIPDKNNHRSGEPQTETIKRSTGSVPKIVKKEVNEVSHVREMNTLAKIATEIEVMSCEKTDTAMRTVIVRDVAGMHHENMSNSFC